MNSLCDSYLTDESLHELSDMSDFFLSSVAENIKCEPADVVEQVGHVIVTSRAPAFVMLNAAGMWYQVDIAKLDFTHTSLFTEIGST